MLHFAQWICDVWPWRYLSVGASIGALERGTGRGVGEREKGFDESMEGGVTGPLVESVEMVDEVVSLDEEEMSLSVEDWRDLRRKESAGRR